MQDTLTTIVGPIVPAGNKRDKNDDTSSFIGESLAWTSDYTRKRNEGVRKTIHKENSKQYSPDSYHYMIARKYDSYLSYASLDTKLSRRHQRNSASLLSC